MDGSMLSKKARIHRLKFSTVRPSKPVIENEMGSRTILRSSNSAGQVSKSPARRRSPTAANLVTQPSAGRLRT